MTGGGYRRAWTITAVIGGVLVTVSAIVFAISFATGVITQRTQSLHVADDALRMATAAHAQLGFANHLSAVGETFDVAVDDELRISSTQASDAYIGSGRVALQLIAQGEVANANELVSGPVADEYQAIFAALETERERQLAAVSASNALAGRLGDIARFLVALLIPVAVMVVFREIVRRQQRQIELETNLQAQQEIAKTRDDFVANASHEFRTPLTSIYGLALLIAEGQASQDEAREMATMISAEAEDLSRMVEDLLTTARLEAGALRYQPQRSLSTEEIAAVVTRFERVGLSMQLDVVEAPMYVDPMRLRQVLRNLISNARKYGGPTITVTGRKNRDRYVWTIADDGPGVPVELESRLFERFVHKGTTVSVPGGVGLGLSIARALAEGMGGSLHYRRHDGWSNFDVEVPLAGVVDLRQDESDSPAPIDSLRIAASSSAVPGDRHVG
jgi:signal transduction histidine kinase